jgi:transcriptional regulator with XRE-family HTH domain
LRHVYSSRYKKFLGRLKQARLDGGLSQVEVAEKLGKPQSYVSKCESGERRVDFIELLVFAEIYRKPIEFFIPDEVEKDQNKN